jgi:tetratricopeptide (TPR) repeat protein
MEAFNSALTSQKAGNREQARNLYLKALAQAPEMVPALRNLSILYLEMSDFENAQENLEKWSTLEPNASDPLVMLSQIQARSGDFDTAASLVEKALKLETDPAKRSQYQKIMAGMQSMSGMNGRNASNRNQPEDEEDDSEASGDRLTSLEKRFVSLKDGDEKDSLLLMLAIAHFESGNWSQARRYASMLLAKDPSQPTAKSIMENLRDKN